MPPRTGLRTEIVVSTVLLLGAALLFAGFLLVKLTEGELLAERRLSLQRIARLLAAGEPAPDALSSRLLPLTRDGELRAWRLLADDFTLRLSFSQQGADLPLQLPVVGPESGDLAEAISYSSSWNLFAPPPDNRLDLAVRVGGPSGGILQLRFGLDSLAGQVHRAQRLILLYVVVYGAILSAFGVYLLGRNVVEPVRRLRAATAGVAKGELTPIAVPGGPAEIVELAEDFNAMVDALQESRAETAAHIRSLEEANAALRQARDEVVRAEKLASVGHLAAGMAHEIGNPLAAVVGYLNLLKLDLVEPAARDLVERSLCEVGRIDHLVRDLLDYAAPARSEVEPFDPVETLREAVALLQGQGVFEGRQLVDRTMPGLGSILMERGRFLQICVNLLLNARDAVETGGEIVLEAARRDGELTVTVADNGAGIDAATLRRVFEPFFTTKAPGQGRGLGLAVCQRLIEEAGGRIAVASTVGTGSRFTLVLPMTGEAG
jgi:signal transduction histidine kinase